MDRIEKLKEFLKVNETDSFLQHALALEYIKIGKEEEARGLFESILQRDPGYVGSYYHLGKLLEKLNEPEKAVTIYEAGLVACKMAGDQHAYSELQGALEEIET